MKRSIILVLSLWFMASCAPQDAIFILKPNSNMSITGKGDGQDAAVNPYLGQDCTAYVKNLSDNPLSVRIEENGKLVKEIEVPGKDQLNIELKKSEVLYLDALGKEAKARVVFKKG